MTRSKGVSMADLQSSEVPPDVVALVVLVYGLPPDEAARRLTTYRDATGLSDVALRERVLQGACDLDKVMA